MKSVEELEADLKQMIGLGGAGRGDSGPHQQHRQPEPSKTQDEREMSAFNKFVSITVVHCIINPSGDLYRQLFAHVSGMNETCYG